MTYAIGMLEECSNIIGLEVYSPEGIFVGKVDDIAVDPSNRAISGLIIREPSPVLVDKDVMIKIPYRWVQSIGDIIILKTFPKHVGNDGTYIS